MLREKILAQLQVKFAGVSKKALGLIADKLAKKVTEESGIDQAITDFDNAVSITDFASDLQREGDSRVGEAKKEWEKKNPPPKDPKNDPPPPGNDPPKDEMPVWAKGLMDQITTLTRDKTQGSIQSKAKELLKDVPETFWNGRALPEKEDDLQPWVEAINKDYNSFKQGLIDQGLMQATPPAGGGAAAGKDGKINEKAIDADIKDWADKGKPAETTKK